MEAEQLTKPQAIVARLTEFLSGGKYAPGDQLPTEKMLMQALSVGRSSLREAIRTLEAMGVVQVRHGTGTFLMRAPEKSEILVPLAIGGERESLLRALDIRRALESHASALAATRASDAQLERIRVTLEAMEETYRREGTALKEDMQFHLAIYEAANNPLFETFIEAIRGQFLLFFSGVVASSDGRGTSSFDQHRELYDAIAARDPEAARLKTLELLDHVEDDVRSFGKH
ncbi:FadR/GntR family transcriptional regulator [Frigidibacter sp. RF13]|uniref:FadR/GntR family transcriptional regulator n=1 Tax=Frigidibacter sp. RF13 TaxID=2997340 RepID=UPI002271631A|nr:FadR/GntR family transcriptional regulator [Frigidibacter sp. RF13]MCY1126106.1 FadR/GntR family transcriptional regulator [Frigidibacter sp. RF13]